MKRVDKSLVSVNRPTGLRKLETRKINEGYSIGNNLQEVKSNLVKARMVKARMVKARMVKARMVIARNSIQNASLKASMIMNIGKAYQNKDNDEWFNEDYSFEDFMHDYHIVEKTARDYEKYFIGLVFYKKLGIDILSQPIRNIRAITTDSFISAMGKSEVKHKVEQMLNTSSVSQKQLMSIISNREQSSYAYDNPKLFQFEVLADKIIITFDNSKKGEIIKILKKFVGEQIKGEKSNGKI